MDSKLLIIIKSCRELKYDQNPALTLKILQKKLLKGSPLEVRDAAVCENGQTNLIMASRNDVLMTVLDEILSLKDKLITLEVQFYGKVS